MNCIAHRGFADAYPENTRTALRQAIGAGADGVEVDVRRCGSGEPVVIHDETVDRVTDRAGPVAALTRAELADCSVLGTGEGVPTLQAVCDLLPADVRLHLELKEAGVAADAVALAADAHPNVLVSSFDVDALEAATEVDDIPLISRRPPSRRSRRGQPRPPRRCHRRRGRKSGSTAPVASATPGRWRGTRRRSTSR